MIAGMGLRLPEKAEHPKFDEWIIILGGSGSVGQFAVQVSPATNLPYIETELEIANGVQIAKRCGYKVLTTCSPANEAVRLHSIPSFPNSNA